MLFRIYLPIPDAFTVDIAASTPSQALLLATIMEWPRHYMRARHVAKCRYCDPKEGVS